MDGGELLVEALVRHRVTHVFGMPGGQANAFYQALSTRRSEIQHVLVRDERSATYAADGFARVSNRLGVCDATVGPGAVKFPSGLMEAYNSSIPILAIISDHPRGSLLLQDRGRISQGGDQLGALRPFTKEVFAVPTTDTIPDVISAAIHTALTGRPGPVVVEIPQDVFTASGEATVRAGDTQYPRLRCVPLRSDIDRAVELLASARRPLILAGGGVHISGAGRQIVELAHVLRAAVATTISGKGAILDSDSKSIGVLGDFGNPHAKLVADQADVVLAVGYKNSQMASYRWTWPRSDQSVVHIDIDPVELGRITTPAVALWGDAGASLDLVLEALRDRSCSADSEWEAVIMAARSRWLALVEGESGRASEPVWPQAVAWRIARAIKGDDHLIFDASFSSGWGAVFAESRTVGRRMLFPRGAAGLGYSVPAALGVAMAAPGARVVCLTGDGAAGYFLGELATVAGLGLPVTTVILNNSSLSWSRWSQQLSPLFRGEVQSVGLSPVDFAMTARGLGMDAWNVASVAELDSALETSLGMPGPSLISVLSEDRQVASFAYRALIKDDRQGPGDRTPDY